jgi:hypothetical protein
MRSHCALKSQHMVPLPKTMVSRASLAGSFHLAARAAARTTSSRLIPGVYVGHSSCYRNKHALEKTDSMMKVSNGQPHSQE